MPNDTNATNAAALEFIGKVPGQVEIIPTRGGFIGKITRGGRPFAETVTLPSREAVIKAAKHQANRA